MTTPSTPAGWYPDPDGSGGLRYWDGFAWTEHRAPAVAPPAATEQRADPSPSDEQATSVVSLPEQPADPSPSDEQATSVVSLPEQPADPSSSDEEATSMVSFTEQPTTMLPRQSTPPSTPDPDDESRSAGAHRAPDRQPASTPPAAPSFETPSSPYEGPPFEAPSFGTPSFETPSFEELSSGTYRTPSTPSYEAPSSEPPSSEAPSDDDAPSTPPYGIPPFQTPSAEAPSYDRPSFEAPSYEPRPYDAPPAAFAGLGGRPGASGGPGGPDNRKLIIGFLSAVGALLLILILVLLWAFVFRDHNATRIASSGPSTSALKTTTSSESPASTTESETTGAPTPTAGDQATEGDFTFSVASTDSGDTVTSPINEYIEKTANGEFFVVYLNVGNSGSAPLTFLSTLQQLKADADTFAPDDEASFYLGGGVVTINPGEQVETAIAFDVPPGTTPTSIQVHGEPGGVGVELPV